MIANFLDCNIIANALLYYGAIYLMKASNYACKIRVCGFIIVTIAVVLQMLATWTMQLFCSAIFAGILFRLVVSMPVRWAEFIERNIKRLIN